MRLALSLLICLVYLSVKADDSWQSALGKMPLGASIKILTRTNCVQTMLPVLQSNDVVKALIFMPGATDEFYMFRRAKAFITNEAPTLLDAVNALTNQTLIKATFRAPFLLLHTDEDPLEPLITVKDAASADTLKRKKFLPHVVYNDRDYDFLLPILRKKMGMRFDPPLHSVDSFHFYRNSFAAWDLNDWETLEAMAAAGKVTISISKKHVVFGGDERVMAVPKFDHFPE